MFPTLRVSAGTRVYLAAVLEYLTAEILELSGNYAKDLRKKRIIPNYIRHAFRNDNEFSRFYGNTIMSDAGGV